MNAYIYQAALYCETCADSLRANLDAFTNPADRDDSDRYPIGPYPDGGGEADSPAHCDHCQAFLENPLTSVGYDYVHEAIADGSGVCAAEWAAFYDLTG
jgi:hypothetical protein